MKLERVKGILNILQLAAMRMMLTHVFECLLRIVFSDGRTLIGFSPFTRRTFNEVGAGEGNRTLASSLGSWRSAIELHPHALRDRRTFLKQGL